MPPATGLQVMTPPSLAADADAPPQTVLIVDDHAINRELMRTYLRQESYRIIEADDGLKALEVIEAEPVDLVLLDIMMPRLNGFATCARIKVAPRAAFLPVILVTALDDRDSRNRGLLAGADDFLTRPVDQTELLLRVRAFLKLRQHEVAMQRQAKRMKRLISLKDDLVTFIFNDLRNPLSGVDGCLHLLQSELRSPSFAPLLEDVNRALAATARVRMILGDVLDVRLLEEGEVPFLPEATPLRALVAAAASTLDGAARAKRIEVRISANGEPSAVIDRKLVRRAVENLISNAIAGSPPGEAIDVDVQGRPHGIAIEVADRGSAIPDERKRKLFDKFGALDGPQGASQPGAAVGLHLVKVVAGLHGGTASVEDRAGGGSVLRLAIPGEARS